MDGQYYNLWSTDNERTDANDEVVIKSVYDPSPIGYSLPASNAFTGFTTTGQNVGYWYTPLPPEERAKFNVKGDFNKGWYCHTKPNKKGQTTFIPVNGFRSYINGEMSSVNKHGYILTNGISTTGRERLLVIDPFFIRPITDNIKNDGVAVRSAEERETHKFNIKEEMDGKYYNLWSTDNDRTDANDEVVIKSVYDPSPVRYSLPASNAFTGFAITGDNTGNPAEYNVKGDFDKGWYFYTKKNKQGATTYFSSCGVRFYTSGTLNYVTTNSYYWTAGPSSADRGRFLNFNSYSVGPLGFVHYRTWGFTVRSAEERETHKFNINSYMDGQYYNLWSTDNDKTVPNDDKVIKSVYDPSPVGYSLPASNAFTGFTTTGQNVGEWNIPGNPDHFNVKFPFDKGWYFYTKPNKIGETLFFYAGGYREFGVGLLSVLNNVGYYWNSITTYNTDGGLFQFQSNFVGPLYGSKKARGFAVRSAEEKKWSCVLYKLQCADFRCASSSPRTAWVPSIYAVMDDTVAHCKSIQHTRRLTL